VQALRASLLLGCAACRGGADLKNRNRRVDE